MINPIVTVFFFAYNHEKYIEKGIKSVLSQETDYPYKLVVVDDCSNDKTPEIVRRYEALYPNKVFLRRTEINHGLNWQFEHALLDTDTKYFTLTGGDDYWIDNRKLQKQIDCLEKNNDVSVVLTGRVFVDEDTDVKTKSFEKWEWKMPVARLDRLCSLFLNKNKGGYPPFTTACICTDIVKKCLIEHPEIIRAKTPGEGSTLVTAICMYGERIVVIDDDMVAYLVRQESLSHHKDPKIQLEYNFSYTELRVNLMKKFGAKPSVLLEHSKELLKNDFKQAYRLNLCDDFVRIVEKSNIDENGKLYVSYLNQHRFSVRAEIFVDRIVGKLYRIKTFL